MQIDLTRCTNCGLCVKKCPDKNLLSGENQIEIYDKYDCLHCLRCMNHCPSNAFKFGKLTVGDNRYTLQLRNQLFHKAISGQREKYWEDFEYIVGQWRKKTLLYWLKHRRNPET